MIGAKYPQVFIVYHYSQIEGRIYAVSDKHPTKTYSCAWIGWHGSISTRFTTTLSSSPMEGKQATVRSKSFPNDRHDTAASGCQANR